MTLTDFVEVESPTARVLLDTSNKILVSSGSRLGDSVLSEQYILTSWNYQTRGRFPGAAIVNLDDKGCGSLTHMDILRKNEANDISYERKIDELVQESLRFWLCDELGIDFAEEIPEEYNIQSAIIGARGIAPVNIRKKLHSFGVKDISTNLVKAPFFDLTFNPETGILHKVEYDGTNCLGVYEARFVRE